MLCWLLDFVCPPTIKLMCNCCPCSCISCVSDFPGCSLFVCFVGPECQWYLAPRPSSVHSGTGFGVLPHPALLLFEIRVRHCAASPGALCGVCLVQLRFDWLRPPIQLHVRE